MFKPSVREEADDEDRQRDSKAQETSTSSKGGLTEAREGGLIGSGPESREILQPLYQDPHASGMRGRHCALQTLRPF